MAIVHVQTTANGTNTGIVSTLAITFGAPVGTGNTVVGQISYADDGATITSIIDDKGNHYTSYDVTQDTGDGTVASQFILGNITGGPTVITLILSNVVQFLVILADEYSGVAASADPRDGHVGNYQATPGTGADALTSTSITTTTNGDLIYGSTCLGSGQNGPLTAGTGYTKRRDTTSDPFVAITASEDQVQGAAGSIAATFTQPNAGGTITFITAIKPLAGAATLPPGTTLNCFIQ